MGTLHLVSDEYGRALIYRGVRISAAPDDKAPFPVDAVAVEEDTNLLLSARSEIRAPAEGFDRLVDAMESFEPAVPGSIVVKGERPVRMLAIVHDIEQTPTWRAEWVAGALASLLTECERRRLKSLCLPVLGAEHGGMRTESFAALLRQAIEEHPWGNLRRIWARLPETETRPLLKAFR